MEAGIILTQNQYDGEYYVIIQRKASRTISYNRPSLVRSPSTYIINVVLQYVYVCIYMLFYTTHLHISTQ